MNKKSLVLTLCLLPIAAFAGQIQIGRYLTAPDKPALSQQNPLEQIVSLTFPASIATIGDAVDYLLQSTGFKLLPAKYRTDEANELLKQKLPLNDRKFSSVTVKNALLALAGYSYLLLIDPKHRYVSFTLKPEFAKLY